MTPFQSHCQRWANGCGNAICERARRVVLSKGKLPCDILFIGEAPGHSENSIGVPFIGPAGKVLDRIIADSGAGKYRLAFTNLVGCIPLNEENDKASEPAPEEIKTCSSRLLEYAALARPRLIVCVGALARDYTDPKMRGSIKIPNVPRVAIDHPARILRSNIAQQGLMHQRCVVTLSNAVEEMEE